MIATHLLGTFILVILMATVGPALMGWGEILRHWLEGKLAADSVNEVVPIFDAAFADY